LRTARPKENSSLTQEEVAQIIQEVCQDFRDLQ